MKKLTILILVLIMASTAYGIPRSAVRDAIGAFSGPRTGKAQDDNVKSSLDALHAKQQGRGSGVDWYVDSAVGAAAGDAWATAVSSIAGAIALAGTDDIIHVGQGHNEAVTLDDEIDLDIAGLHVIGYGVGPRMPRLDFDAEGIESAFVIGASGVIVEGIAFLPSVSGISAAVEFEATAAGSIVRNCVFLSGEVKGVDEFNTAIRIASGVWDWTVDNNIFDAGSAGASSAITINPSSGAMLSNNTIFGDYSSACVSTWNNESVKMFVLDNIMINGELRSNAPLNAEPAFAFRDGCQGLVKGNTFASNSAHGTSTFLQQRKGLDMIFIQNIITDDAGEEFTAGYVWGGPNESITSSAEG